MYEYDEYIYSGASQWPHKEQKDGTLKSSKAKNLSFVPGSFSKAVYH